MKILSKVLLLALLGSLTLTGCWIDDDTDVFGCVNGAGPIVSEVITLPSFDAIIVDMAADVFLTQGDEQSVTIEAKANIIDEIERRVSGGVWRIDTDRCVRDADQVTIYITVPDLRMVKISGSGDVVGENTFEVGDMELNISGSGDIDLGLIADDVDAKISGSGNIMLDGQADELHINISGSGEVRAFDLPVRESSVIISGSGDAEVTVEESLTIRISGSGDVFYRGNPTLDISVSGSGDVIDDN
ncbi:MAG: DUF2807 domain-containing protein [Lewinella sp.]|nr:DUF2807 domain-containing protein [Lewinella sp.]